MSEVTTRWTHCMIDASWQGGVAFALLWLLCRQVPRLPSRLRCWLWRLAYLKLLLTFLGLSPVRLLVLPASEPGWASVATSAGDSVRWPRATHFGAATIPRSRVDALPVFFMALWLVGVGGGLLRLGVEGSAAQRLKRRSVPESDPLLLTIYTQLCRQFAVGRPPALLRKEGGGSPLLGGPEPAIVLPSARYADCTPEELRLMLAHELAHLKRGDLWWGWLPAIARCLFFFHPLLGLANREWHLAQELACDALTLRVTAAGAGDYGTALLKAAAQGRVTPDLGLAAVSRDDFPRALALRLRFLAGSQPVGWLWLWIVPAIAVGLIPLRLAARQSPQPPDAIAALRQTDGAEARRHWLAGALALTDRQAVQLQGLILATDRRAARLQAADSMPAAEREGLIHSLFATTETEIEAALNLEQRRMLEKIGGIKVIYFALNPQKGAITP